MSTTVHDFNATSLDGKPVDLADYSGQVVLIVNTASQCGFTPQYAGLQKLHDDYGDQGFAVLGFPCDQFGNQEFDTEDEIAAFCERNYGVGFPMFSKVDVNGDDAHPLFEHLKHKKSGALGKNIKWNFTKFLVGRDGQVLKRFGPSKDPEKLRPRIEEALAEGQAPPSEA